MKLSKISLALVAMCAAAPSFALTAASYTNTNETTGDTLNIRISGATAQDSGILGSALSLCTVGTMHRYVISNNFVHFCTPDIGVGPGQITVPAGKTKLAIYKYSVGGSAFGVTPIQSSNPVSGAVIGSDGAQLPFLDLAKINSLCSGTLATTTNLTFGSGTTARSYVNVACSNSSSALTTLATTYIGVSDVEPAFFTDQTSNITAATSYALIFGVPVTLNIRNAMQTQQIAAGTLAAGCVGLDTEACMPSLTSAQMTSAYTQPFQTWGGLGITSGLADDAIYVARRVNSSGTQKVFEALFARSANGEPSYKSCSVGVEPFSEPDSGSAGLNVGDNASLCSTAPPLVYGGSGSSNVRTCMVNHHAAGRGSIGILTTEEPAGTANWRFVKIDGVAPTQANVAKGSYRHYVESTLNTRTSGALATSTALGYTAVVNRLKADFANPAIINQINLVHPFGNAGVMALLPSGGTPDYTGATPVIPWTKLVGGSTLDNCQSPKAVF